MISEQSPYFIVTVLVFSLFIIHPPVPAEAQIVTDGTLGAAESLSGPDYRIPAKLGKQTGANLFHSFGQFRIHSGESATFNGPDSVSNIITRVTGGSTSRIDGLLRSEIPGANLWLLNPAGVMFGPEASLDISGSFHVSTADYLRLGGNGRFDVTHPENDVLTTFPPSAFGFLDDTPGTVCIQGMLTVPTEQTLSVTGGDIDIEGGLLMAPGGNIRIGAAASPGEVRLTDSVPDAETLGDIHIRGAMLDVSSYDDRSGGDIMLNADQAVVSDGAQVIANAFASGRGGDISVNVRDSLSVSGPGSGLYANAYPGSIGNAGRIRVSANAVSVTDSGVISGQTGGEGHGADVVLETDRLEISDRGMVTTASSGTGHSGNAEITASESVSVTGAGVLTAMSDADEGGNGGTISVNTDILTIADEGLINNGTVGEGQGGDIILEADRLEISRGYISSSAAGQTPDAGHGGKVEITAHESVTIAGSGEDDAGVSAKYYGIYVQSQGPGDSGNLSVAADTLSLTKDAMINGQAFGSGHGGDIGLTVSRLEVHEGGTITASTRGAGDSGNIEIAADISVSISGAGAKYENSWIYTATHSSGNGGRLTISAPSLEVGEHGMIWASTLGDDTRDGNTLPDGDAGNIFLNAGNMRLHQGGTVSSGSECDGNGGNIDIRADHLEMRDNALITARSTGAGDAGDIRIASSDTIRIQDSSVTTSADNSGGGRMTISGGASLSVSAGELTTSVQGGTENAGDITADAGTLILDSSSVIASAYEGNGGNIRIKAEHFIRSSDSRTDASSELGLPGKVETSPEADIGSRLILLPDDFPDISSWISTPCGQRSGGDVSRLLIQGRDAIPTPFDDLRSFLPCPETRSPSEDAEKDDTTGPDSAP